MDISWASDGSAFVTASADNTCMIWDPEARRGKLRLQGHRHLVQGCAWDPQLQYLVSASADRTCRCSHTLIGQWVEMRGLESHHVPAICTGVSVGFVACKG